MLGSRMRCKCHPIIIRYLGSRFGDDSGRYRPEEEPNNRPERWQSE
jgi:hypothetical protein